MQQSFETFPFFTIRVSICIRVDNSSLHTLWKHFFGRAASEMLSAINKLNEHVVLKLLHFRSPPCKDLLNSRRFLKIMTHFFHMRIERLPRVGSATGGHVKTLNYVNLTKFPSRARNQSTMSRELRVKKIGASS